MQHILFELHSRHNINTSKHYYTHQGHCFVASVSGMYCLSVILATTHNNLEQLLLLNTTILCLVDLPDFYHQPFPTDRQNHRNPYLVHPPRQE